jgi:hypothetical protein
MRRALFPVIAGLAAALLVGLPAAQAQMPGPNLAPPPALPGNSQQTASFTVPQQVVDDRVAFNSSEHWIIAAYYTRVREKQHRAARSKKYKRDLPAGLSRDPARGDLLPMTILATLDRLPGALLRELPPARPNTDRVMVGKNILMVSTASGEVLDILSDVLF